MSSHSQQPMMFAAAPGDDAGLAYVREYVGAQLAVGRLPAQILASFGAAQADPGVTVDTAELCRMVLAHVHTVQEEQLPRALVAAAREGRVDELTLNLTLTLTLTLILTPILTLTLTRPRRRGGGAPRGRCARGCLTLTLT